MRNARLAFVDAVRGLAAVAVLVGHSLESTSPQLLHWTSTWFSPGRAGVCAFFLVSGFVIPLSLERGAEGTATKEAALRRFAIGRVGRLYPMYWASLVLVLLLSWLGFDSLPADFEAELPWAAVVNATMLQEFVGVPNAIGIYYTLTIELIWYAGCAALFARGWLHATERLAWAALAGLALVGIGVPVLLDRHTPFSTGFYLVTMLIGTALARNAAGRLRGERVAVLVLAALAVAAVGSWANYVHTPGVTPEGPLGFSAAVLSWVVAYVAVLAAYLLRDRPGLFPSPVLWLGLISYSLYLLHPAVLAVVFEWTIEPLPVLAWVLVLSILASAITQRRIERPGQELARRRQRRSMRV